MTSAIDCNILSSLWGGETTSARAEELLLAADRAGKLIICPVVYAELLARPHIEPDFVEHFLGVTGINIDFDLDQEIWREAGIGFAAYCCRRRKGNQQGPRRFVADYLIGAHAMRRADRLITFNGEDFRRDFPRLVVVS